MRKNEIMELLRAACGCALRQDMRGYHNLMEQARAAIEKTTDGDALRGEYLMASSFGFQRNWEGLYSIYREALSLLGGRSYLFPNGSHLFADYYNVFAICNTVPGHADEKQISFVKL